MSRGGGGGGTTETTTTAEPYAPSEPYLADIMREAENLYRSGTGMQYYPGSTVVPMSGQTHAGLTGMENIGAAQLAGSPLMDQGAAAMSGYAAGQAPSTYGGSYSGIPTQSYSGMAQLSPQQAYLGDLRSTLANQAVQGIQSEFAGMGRTGLSPGAAGAATEAFTSAYAPIATQVSEDERNRQLSMQQDALARAQGANQFQTQAMMGGQLVISGQDWEAANQLGQAQQLQAAGALPGMQSALDARQLSGATAIGQAGQQREGYAGQYLQEDMQRYQFEQMAPYQRLGQYAGAILPISGQFPITTGQQPNPRYNAMTGALGGAMSGASMAGNIAGLSTGWGAMLGAGLGFFSDRRLKENYKIVGKSPSGINIYQFKYKGSNNIYEGVMADEVPYATYEDASGYDIVDYNKVDVEFRRIA